MAMVEKIKGFFILCKGRNPLTKLAGKTEGAPIRNILKNPKKMKMRPNSSGYKPLQQPKFGLVANRTKSKATGATKSVTGVKKPKLGHGDFMPGYFKRNMHIEFSMADGTKGRGRVRNSGNKGVQVVADTGKILNLFHDEIKGKVLNKNEKKQGKK